LELGPEEKENSQNRSSIFGKQIKAGFLSNMNFQMGSLQNASKKIKILKKIWTLFLAMRMIFLIASYQMFDFFSFGLPQLLI